MEIEKTTINGIGILSFNGNLVLKESAEFKGLIKPYLEDENCSGLICNLEQVNHIDSSGLGVIVYIYKSLKQADKKFALCGLNTNNRELLNLSKLDKLLVIAENSESAIQILSG